MSEKMKIDVALTNLEASKFSFRMVDAIKDHIGGLENELEVARDRHDSVIRDLKLQQIANWRLEAELTKLNAQIYALLKQIMPTKSALRELTPYANKTGECLVVLKKYVRAYVEKALAYLSTLHKTAA